MGVILFAGGEDSEFIRTSTNCTVDTAQSGIRRTQYTRAALKVVGLNGDYWAAKFPGGGVTNFWFSTRWGYTNFNYPAQAGRGIAFVDGSNVVRLAVCPGNMGTNSALPYTQIALCKFDSANNKTILATSSQVFPGAGATVYAKFDIQVVNYGTSATVRVYLENVLVLTYTGDVTTEGSASITGVRLHAMDFYASNWSWNYYSEIIAATIDTRTLTLATLAPAAAGNAYAWTGAVSTINETTLDDTTIAYTTAAGQLLEATVTNTTVPGTCGVVSLVIGARAQKGNNGGPANANMVVRTGSADYTSPNIALPTGAFDLVQYSWDTNPANSGVWVPTDLTAAGFNVGIKSVA